MFHVIVCFEKRYPILLESFKTYSEGVSCVTMICMKLASLEPMLINRF
jgi:hypothetical protein